jgi:UDP-N-acetylglucosamine/UDP-N-acetylgalactosamine diphosphorylase
MLNALPDFLRIIFEHQPKLKAHFEGLSHDQKAALQSHLAALDSNFFMEISTILAQAAASGNNATVPPYTAPTVIPHPLNGGSASVWSAVAQKGIEAIVQGKVGLITVAGGQGTRLGHPGPKGTFPITPITKKSLFQVFAEKILAAQFRYQVVFPWLIMTSPINHNETVAFFESHHYFGLKADQVHFFNQNLLPATDFEGNCLFESPTSLCLSPDGHGGFFKAMAQSGLLKVLEAKGIRTLSYFQVDNPLIQPVDPVFIGFHRIHESEFSSKMVERRDFTEKVGLFVEQEGHLKLLEYSDAPKSLLEALNTKKQLQFSAANIAVHLLEVSFIEKVAESKLPYHLARKKIPHWGQHSIEPEAPNGLKFEHFLFDALPLAKNPIILEALRQEAFSPVKNAEGPDSPKACELDQIALWHSWLQKADIRFRGFMEISPLWADSEAAFLEKLASLPEPLHLQYGIVLA